MLLIFSVAVAILFLLQFEVINLIEREKYIIRKHSIIYKDLQ